MNKWLENTWNDTVFWREVKQEKEHEGWRVRLVILYWSFRDYFTDEAALKDKNWIYVSIWGNFQAKKIQKCSRPQAGDKFNVDILEEKTKFKHLE